MTNIPLDTIREAIAEALHSVNAGILPDVCVRLGLSDGSADEAMRSKRSYVRARLGDHKRDRLIQVAQMVIEEIGAPELADFISELTTHAQQRVSDLTKRAVLNALNDVGELFGAVLAIEGLGVLRPNWNQVGPVSGFSASLLEDVRKHFILNPDWTNSEVLQHCGALTCTQQRFFDMLERVLHPECREGEAQAALAQQFDSILLHDGFTVAKVGELSRRPVYGVRKFSGGVAGTPKNLIFAAINSKPDLFLLDSINNDVGIQNEHDALIYDRFLPEAGLTWHSLVEWWKALKKTDDYDTAHKDLYRRMIMSVKQSNSPVEMAVFDTYYRYLGPLHGKRLPALIPQVYLHYDPKTARQRGANRVIARERMDFLLLLDCNVRVVIEVDGQHHYAEMGRASPAKYAQMVAEDRRLRLLGYEVYRFGGHEFPDTVVGDDSPIDIGVQSRKVVSDFFEQLFSKHNVT